MSVPPRVTTVAHKRPRSFCQKCRWQVTPKTHICPGPGKVRVGWLCFPSILCEPITEENELTFNSSGNTWSESSPLAEPLWTDPGLKSGIDRCELAPLKKIKRAGRKRIIKPPPKILASEEKATTTTTTKTGTPQYNEGTTVTHTYTFTCVWQAVKTV